MGLWGWKIIPIPTPVSLPTAALLFVTGVEFSSCAASVQTSRVRVCVRVCVCAVPLTT